MDIPRRYPTAAARPSRRWSALAALVAAGAASACGPREVLVAVHSRATATRVVRAELAERGIRDVQVVEDIGHLPAGRFGGIEYAARLAVMPEVAVVIGPSDSRTALMTAPFYNSGGLSQIVPTATSGALRHVGPWTFMLAPGDSLEARFIAAFAAAGLGARRATLFYINDEYGISLRNALLRELPEHGLSVVDEVYYGDGACANGVSGAFDQLLPASLARARPDLMIVVGRDADAGCLLRRARSRAPGLRFILADGVEMTGDFIAGAGAAADSAYAVAFWDPAAPDSLSRALVSRFLRIVGREPTPGEGLMYDAIWRGVDAARAARGSRAGTRRELERMWAAPRATRDPAPLMMRWRDGRRVRVAGW